MIYLLTRSTPEYQIRTSQFREKVAPYVARMDAALNGSDLLARYIEPSATRQESLLTRYRRIVAWPVRQLEYSFVLDAAPPVAGQRMLDAGCGITPLAHVYASAGAEAHAIDGDASLINLLSEEGRSLYGESVHYAAGDVTRLEYPDHTFDVVASISVLEHLPRGRDTAAVREMLRVLKPGGVLAITVDVVPPAQPTSLRATISSVARWVRRRISGTPRPRKHTRPYTATEIERQLMTPFRDALQAPATEPPEALNIDSIRRFWTENWTEGCGYDALLGRKYAAAGLVFRKRYTASTEQVRSSTTAALHTREP
jgi:ubiquinone/menaquinone biosynthesis C-methylase UbiE